MTSPSDPERAHARFIKAELDLGFTFTTIASHRYETGYKESAGKSILNAENIEIRDLTAELQRLREKLVELDRCKDKGRST
jgi:hypothetical protein